MNKARELTKGLIEKLIKRIFKILKYKFKVIH